MDQIPPLITTALPDGSGPPAAQCASTHCKHFSGTAGGIPIWLSNCKTCWSRYDPWRPHPTTYRTQRIHYEMAWCQNIMPYQCILMLIFPLDNFQKIMNLKYQWYIRQHYSSGRAGAHSDGTIASPTTTTISVSDYISRESLSHMWTNSIQQRTDSPDSPEKNQKTVCRCVSLSLVQNHRQTIRSTFRLN